MTFDLNTIGAKPRDEIDLRQVAAMVWSLFLFELTPAPRTLSGNP